jgi:hypothetical protein
MTIPREIHSQVVPDYVFRRWKRYGHDRLYVAPAGAPEGQQLGYRDLTTGIDHPSDPADGQLLSAVADTWSGRETTTSAPTAASAGAVANLPLPAPPTRDPWRDLTHNRPGEACQTEAMAKRAEAPVKTALARVLGVHTSERAWRIGAKGERLVAEQLDKLSRRDERWTAIHAIPVGIRRADIDHLVIGPGGVFSLNTKHHPDADVWVGGDTLMINGGRVPYVRNSRHEAERATRLLSAAVGRPVPVAGMIVLVGCNLPIKIKTAPRDVHVVTRRKLASWFSGLGQVWSDAELTDIWEAARRSTTWSG